MSVLYNMIDLNYQYAVVGASNNTEKYGHRVFKDLLEGGYKVIPINPHEEEILGEKVYAKLRDYSGKVDVVIFVVPPAVTLNVLNEITGETRRGVSVLHSLKGVWMQPGSESPEAIKFCEENGIECVHDACIMIRRRIKDKN